MTPARREVIKTILRRRREGAEPKDIAFELNLAGHTKLNGKPFKSGDVTSLHRYYSMRATVKVNPQVAKPAGRSMDNRRLRQLDRIINRQVMPADRKLEKIVELVAQWTSLSSS